MEILGRVVKKSLIIILPVAAVSAFFEWKKLPAGIIAGGIFGIMNLRGLVRNVEGIVGSEKAVVRMVFLSMTRLFILFGAIFLLIWLQVVNVLGMLLGFTVVFVLILVEGVKVGDKN
jgi:hypothetical protein